MSVQIGPRGTRGQKIPVGRSVMAFGMRLIVGVTRLTGGTRKGTTLLLTTTGARSGQRRTVPVAAFREGDGWLIVGSLGGAATHPAWVHNLAKNPEAEIETEGRKVRVRAATLHGDERARHWQRITTERPNFAVYETKTDREIPVIRLTPLA
jgi:deazaflavin-dependent oxidoreductase (nitroreductase family)